MSKKAEEAKERDVLYEKLDKLLDPIMEELKGLEYHRRHEIIEQIILALFKTLCNVEKLGILEVVANRVRFEAGQKILKDMAPDLMDTVQSVMEKQKAR